MRATFLLLASCLALAAGARKSQRIVGGSVTNINQYPYATALLYARVGTNFRQSCGGTILNNRAVLSAAHCFFRDNANQWRMRVGSTYASSGGVVHNTNRIIMHPQYNDNTLDNDVAILHSRTTFSFNNNVRAGSIAGANYNVADNQAVWAIGWGLTSHNGRPSEQLRHVQVWTVNQAVCRNRYAQIRNVVTDNMLCAGWLDVGGRDACTGDSGGPLLHNGVVIGVCSWGEQCALPFFPGVNARVSRYTSWITANR